MRGYCLCCQYRVRRFILCVSFKVSFFVRKFDDVTTLEISVESYVRSLSRPDLLDLLVHPASAEDVIMEEVEDLRPSKKKVLYAEVL